MLVAVARFMREHYKGVLVEDAVEQVKKCIDILFCAPQVQSDDNIFITFREYLSNFEAVKDSPLYKKVYKLIMYILSFTLFRDKNCAYTSMGYTAMEAAAMRLKFHAGPDLIYTILDTITYLGEKGYDIYKYGFSMNLIRSSSRFDRYVQECKDVQDTCANKDQMEMLDESALLEKVEFLLAQGEDMLRCKNLLNKFELTFLQRQVSEIRFIKLDILSFRGATRARKAPFAMLFYGDSGIGKSTILKITIATCCAKMDLPNDDSHIYTRNAVEQFWNNFRTHMHTIILDDVAFRNPQLQDPAGVDEVIQVCNDVNHVPNQAALEDKGRIPNRAKVVLATTNTKDLHAYHYFSNPGAVQRRFKYTVTLKVLPQFKNPVTGMLDPALVPEFEDDEYPDLWAITIEKVTPPPVVHGSKQPNLLSL